MNTQAVCSQLLGLCHCSGDAVGSQTGGVPCLAAKQLDQDFTKSEIVPSGVAWPIAE